MITDFILRNTLSISPDTDSCQYLQDTHASKNPF